MQLIKNWEELSKVPANDKFKIIIENNMCCGYVISLDENEEIDFGVNYHYLSTHTFYGSTCKESTALLQKCGFDVEIDNWDKEQSLENNIRKR